MNKCGTCKFAMPTKDIGHRICFGGPPQVVAMPQQTPQGVIFVPSNIRPGITVNDPSCSFYTAGVYGVDDLVKQEDGTYLPSIT